jgi:hypothetical protein
MSYSVNSFSSSVAGNHYPYLVHFPPNSEFFIPHHYTSTFGSVDNIEFVDLDPVTTQRLFETKLLELQKQFQETPYHVKTIIRHSSKPISVGDMIAYCKEIWPDCTLDMVRKGYAVDFLFLGWY